MRWPLSWLFRTAAEPSLAEGEAARHGSPGEERGEPGAGLPASVPSRPAGAWGELPPLRPTVARLELTAPTEPFQRELAVSHEPEPVLGHLGHDIRADGPAGLVSGLARPIVVPAADVTAAARMGGPALPMRHHVQRLGAVESTPPVGLAEAGDAAPSLPGVDLAGVDEPRSLAVVAPEAVAPAIAATSVAPESAPPLVRGLAPLVGRLATTAEAAPSVAGAAPTIAGPIAAPPQAGEAPAEAAGYPATSPAHVRGGPPVQPLRRTLGESRRLGLGAPIPTVPVSALDASRTQVPAPGRAGGPIGTEHVEAAVVARAPAPAPARAAAAPLPVLRLARAEVPPATAPSLAEWPAEPVSPGTGPVAAPPPPVTAPTPLVAPLVGTSPLPGMESVASPAWTEAAAEESEPASWPAAVGPGSGRASPEMPPAGRAAPPSAGLPISAPGAARPPARASGDAGAAPGPAWAGAAAPGPEPSPPGPTTPPRPAQPPPHPVVARLLGERPLRPGVEPLIPLAAPEEPEAPREKETGAIPGLEGLAVPDRRGPGITSVPDLAASTPAAAGALPPASPLPAPRSATDRRPVDEPAGQVPPHRAHPAAGPGPRPGALPVARLAAPRPTGIPPDVAASDAPAVQAVLAAGSWSASTGPIAAGPAAAGPGAVEHPAAAGRGPSTAVQRQAETGAVESAAGGADAPAAGGPAGAGGNRDQDMDELARKLYGRIRERLGAELLADRERAGLLVDA